MVWFVKVDYGKKWKTDRNLEKQTGFTSTSAALPNPRQEEQSG